MPPFSESKWIEGVAAESADCPSPHLLFFSSALQVPHTFTFFCREARHLLPLPVSLGQRPTCRPCNWECPNLTAVPSPPSPESPQFFFFFFGRKMGQERDLGNAVLGLLWCWPSPWGILCSFKLLRSGTSGSPYPPRRACLPSR